MCLVKKKKKALGYGADMDLVKCILSTYEPFVFKWFEAKVSLFILELQVDVYFLQ